MIKKIFKFNYSTSRLRIIVLIIIITILIITRIPSLLTTLTTTTTEQQQQQNNKNNNNNSNNNNNNNNSRPWHNRGRPCIISSYNCGFSLMSTASKPQPQVGPFAIMDVFWSKARSVTSVPRRCLQASFQGIFKLPVYQSEW